MNQVQAGLDLTAVPQALQLRKLEGVLPPVWALTVVMPCATVAILLDRDAAVTLADSLRKECSGLAVARDLPPTNGQQT